MDIICGIYKITSPTERVYIGESKDINLRWKSYRGINNSKTQKKLHYSFKKYGIKNHIFEVIEECDFDDLLCRERYWQDFYNVLNGGLNCELTNCGDIKKIRSQQSKDKQSEIAKGKNNAMYDNYGKLNPFYGKSHTEEQKKRWSLERKGELVCGNHAKAKRIINDSNSEIFQCKADVLKFFKIGERYFYKLINSYGLDGYFFRFLDNHTVKNAKIIDRKNNIIYNSLKEASDILKYNKHTLSKYLRGVINNKTNLTYLKEMEIKSQNEKTKVYINEKVYVVNFGNIPKNSKFSEKIQIEGDLKGLKIEPTCSCTLSEITKKGDNIYEIDIKYKNTHIQGDFTKTLKMNYLLLDDSKVNTVFKITGSITI